MWYKWLVFVIAFLLVPIGSYGMKKLCKEKVKFNEKQEKDFNAKLRLGVIFFWLIDLFYMTFIIHSLVFRFVFGGIIILMVFFNLSRAFLNNKDPRFNFWLLQDFLIGVFMSIYLIYIIPDQSLKDVVIPVVSAVFGGLITLVGVAWTIRHTQNERKKDEIQKAKPMFSFNMLFKPQDTKSAKKVCFDNCYESYKCVLIAEIENSDHSLFSIERVFHDNKWWELEANKVVLPSKTIYFEIKFEDINNLFIEVKDALNNAYYYELKAMCLALINPNSNDMPFVHTIREIIEISYYDVERKINNIDLNK